MNYRINRYKKKLLEMVEDVDTPEEDREEIIEEEIDE